MYALLYIMDTFLKYLAILSSTYILANIPYLEVAHNRRRSTKFLALESRRLECEVAATDNIVIFPNTCAYPRLFTADSACSLNN